MKARTTHRLSRWNPEEFVWDQKRCDQFLRSIRREAKARSEHREHAPKTEPARSGAAPLIANAGAPAR